MRAGPDRRARPLRWRPKTVRRPKAPHRYPWLDRNRCASWPLGSSRDRRSRLTAPTASVVGRDGYRATPRCWVDRLCGDHHVPQLISGPWERGREYQRQPSAGRGSGSVRRVSRRPTRPAETSLWRFVTTATLGLLLVLAAVVLIASLRHPLGWEPSRRPA